MNDTLNQEHRPYRLSVVIMVKNEAKNLEQSLPALKGWIDELIVLDSGSTDHSQSLVEAAGGQWYVNAEWPGFGKQRQIAQSYATGDWILALDADEVITEQLKKSILDAIQTQPENTVYGVKRIDCIFGHEIDNPLWPIKAHWRLYPKHFQYNDNLVHESVDLKQAETQALKGYMLHQTADTPQFWLDKRLAYAKAWAEDRHQKGKTVSIFSVFFHALWAFIKQYFIDGRFLMGKYGFVYALLFSQYTFNKYAILYDLKHNPAETTFQKILQQQTLLQLIQLDEKKATVSLVMIAKNESRHLAACLETVHDIVDEIIILDSGSTDNTREIAEKYGAKWFVNKDWQGFGKQRQLAQSFATQEYVLVMDPDERLDQSLRESIVNVLNQPLQRDKVFSFARVNFFCGVEVQKRFWYTDKLGRLYSNQDFKYSSLEVHESLDQKNVPSVRLNGYLPHLTNDDLHHFLLKNIRYSHDWASDKYKNGKKVNLFALIFRSIFSFIREYIIRGDFIGGAYGFILAMASMGYTLDKYLMLWEKNNQK
ncbi:MAG: glycosyltransferase family 2 protein [Candidatus Acinetobacter avistercoris]|nr:glycosyltransferase family 2 protein [Candidatus Acinetobacter avistercoris]